MSMEDATTEQTSPAAATPASAIPAEELARLTDDIVSALKTVYDPEIPADIYELGLIYKVDIDDSRHVSVDMTLTAPGCPVAGDMPIWVEDAATRRNLLQLHLLAKALYEINYEADHRPEWIETPIRGVLALLDQAGDPS